MQALARSDGIEAISMSSTNIVAEKRNASGGNGRWMEGD
jgi:hypothetical protein